MFDCLQYTLVLVNFIESLDVYVFSYENDNFDRPDVGPNGSFGGKKRATEQVRLDYLQEKLHFTQRFSRFSPFCEQPVTVAVGALFIKKEKKKRKKKRKERIIENKEKLIHRRTRKK